jgi:predicted enzyme related to lactoylglutathione lyase
MKTGSDQHWSLQMAAPLEPGIVCVDLERMFNFYTEVLRLRFATDAEASAEMSTRFGTGPDGFRIIRLQTSYGERIKLVQPKKMNLPSIPVPEWVFARPGIAYLTFIVPEIQDIMERLKEFGVMRMSEEAIEIRKGITAIFACDPEGNFLEFVQYADLKAYRPDLFGTAKHEES